MRIHTMAYKGIEKCKKEQVGSNKRMQPSMRKEPEAIPPTTANKFVWRMSFKKVKKGTIKFFPLLKTHEFKRAKWGTIKLFPLLKTQ
jgi:hypothetical protein